MRRCHFYSFLLRDDISSLSSPARIKLHKLLTDSKNKINGKFLNKISLHQREILRIINSEKHKGDDVKKAFIVRRKLGT